MNLLSAYEARYPEIKWREPTELVMPGGKGLGCRVCIAALGLRADETDRLFSDRAEFDEHFATHLEGQAPSPDG